MASSIPNNTPKHFNWVWNHLSIKTPKYKLINPKTWKIMKELKSTCVMLKSNCTRSALALPRRWKGFLTSMMADGEDFTQRRGCWTRIRLKTLSTGCGGKGRRWQRSISEWQEVGVELEMGKWRRKRERAHILCWSILEQERRENEGKWREIGLK